VIECLLLVVSLLRATVRARGDLVAENLLLRHQLAVLTRPTRRRPRLRPRDRLFWLLARLVRRDWHRHLIIVTPATVVRWHGRGWRLFWRWRSRAPMGRPRVSAEVRELIATMARDNPAWGAERIRGELLKLGIAVSKSSVQRYRRRGPARPPSQSWRTFLRNHRPHTWAMDLLSV
jgi:putative transposase